PPKRDRRSGNRAVEHAVGNVAGQSAYQSAREARAGELIFVDDRSEDQAEPPRIGANRGRSVKRRKARRVVRNSVVTLNRRRRIIERSRQILAARDVS